MTRASRVSARGDPCFRRAQGSQCTRPIRRHHSRPLGTVPQPYHPNCEDRANSPATAGGRMRGESWVPPLLGLGAVQGCQPQAQRPRTPREIRMGSMLCGGMTTGRGSIRARGNQRFETVYRLDGLRCLSGAPIGWRRVIPSRSIQLLFPLAPLYKTLRLDVHSAFATLRCDAPASRPRESSIFLITFMPRCMCYVAARHVAAPRHATTSVSTAPVAPRTSALSSTSSM